MFPDRHSISIEEVSFGVYQQVKGRQKIKPPLLETANTIYGQILESTNFSPGNIARQLSQKEVLDGIRRINALIITPENNKIWLKRKTIYSSPELKELPSPGELENIIINGRGLDIVFQGEDVKKRERGSGDGVEKHFYRLFGGQLALVQVQIPYTILSEGRYQFRRTSNQKYKTLRATGVMPSQEVKEQFLQRRTL